MGNAKMCKQVGLLVRGRTFYFQVRIPKDCAHHFPKSIIRERLTATTHPEAKAQVRQRWAEFEAQLARLRNPPVRIDEDDAKHILEAVVASRLDADQRSRS